MSTDAWILVTVFYDSCCIQSFTEVLEQMRAHLKRKGYSQIPQLSSMNPINVNHKFDLVPDTATGTRRAVMIGINYVGK